MVRRAQNIATFVEELAQAVRVMAAAYLLRYRTEDALAVLRDVAGGEGAGCI